MFSCTNFGNHLRRLPPSQPNDAYTTPLCTPACISLSNFHAMRNLWGNNPKQQATPTCGHLPTHKLLLWRPDIGEHDGHLPQENAMALTVVCTSAITSPIIITYRFELQQSCGTLEFLEKPHACVTPTTCSTPSGSVFSCIVLESKNETMIQVSPLFEGRLVSLPLLLRVLR